VAIVLGALLVVAVVLATNWAWLTSNNNARTPVDTEPTCDAMEPMWLQAQAVPTAQLVPCVASLPVGWSFSMLTVNEGRSTITIDHDRAGADAIELRFSATCDTNGATELPSDVAGARRFERRPGAEGDALLTSHVVFDGGCATVNVDSRTAASQVVVEVAAQAGQVIGFVTRTDLARALDARSDGRLRLDPRS
jgi:hypothetical protein